VIVEAASTGAALERRALHSAMAGFPTGRLGSSATGSPPSIHELGPLRGGGTLNYCENTV
jgi:hypothetical protein